MKYSFSLLFASALLAFASCGNDEPGIVIPEPGQGTEQPEEKPSQPEELKYNEAFRPQVHFTPARNWINDPNGMVYYEGTWHLFYQYNPYGNDWGNMSWGHATSTDLIHWTEQDVALVKDELGDIFSGSCVIDKDNTAGFGKNAMVAFFTSAGAHQQQSMAYSTDGGKYFYKYGQNPIVANTDKADFRDPKVFWDEDNHQWVMSLARGWSYAIDFYTSTNLKQWTLSGSFSYPDGALCNKGQWECPDLLTMQAPDGTTKHVLIVSVNPGGPNGGSGTFYFPGTWDGKTFTADELTAGEYPLWVDYGCDNYAGVTWSNAPDGRVIFIGWMNNWLYSGAVPCSPWRSAMTLPREFKLVDTPDGLRLAQTVVKEIENIAGQWADVTPGAEWAEGDAYHLQVTLDVTKNSVLTLSNGTDNVEITFNGGSKALSLRRGSSSGQANFNGFSLPGIRAYYSSAMTGETTVDLYIDRSSIELFAGEVSTAQGGCSTIASTNLFFPAKIYNSVSLSGQTLKARVRPLKNIWRK